MKPAQHQGSNKARLLETAERLQDERTSEIQQRSHDEFVRLVRKFDAAVASGQKLSPSKTL